MNVQTLPSLKLFSAMSVQASPTTLNLVVDVRPGTLKVANQPDKLGSSRSFQSMVVVNLNAPRPAHAKDQLRPSSRLDRIMRDPARAEAMATARARFGSWMEAEPSMQQMSISALRLKAGLSQSELAVKLGTSQPNIARFEKNPGNPTLEVMRKWAAALGVDISNVVQAVMAATSPQESEATHVG